MNSGDPSAGLLRRPRTGTGKHINQMLLVLLADGLAWRASEEHLWGWIAECPFCRLTHPHPGFTLKMRIDNDDWLPDDAFRETGTLVVGCSKRCVTPAVLRTYLMRDPSEVFHQREMANARAQIRWWKEFALRQAHIDEAALRRLEATLVH